MDTHFYLIKHCGLDNKVDLAASVLVSMGTRQWFSVLGVIVCVCVCVWSTWKHVRQWWSDGSALTFGCLHSFLHPQLHD